MNNTYNQAVQRGYPVIAGNPRVFDGYLCNRFERTKDDGTALFVGWKSTGKRTGCWIIRKEIGGCIHAPLRCASCHAPVSGPDPKLACECGGTTELNPEYPVA